MSKTIVITGASDGIGAAAARRLSARNRVVVVGRDPEKTRAVAGGIGADHFAADFKRLDEVRDLAGKLGTAYPRIDVLMNNAGGVFSAAAKTADGFEQTFQINHLAPFLLTSLLIDNLIAARATVIQTSSVAARMAGRLDLDDLNSDRKYDSRHAYGFAKLENILFTKELHRRYHDRGLKAAAIHPGNVATSFGAATDDPIIGFIVRNPITRRLLLTSPEKGADQLVWLAENDGWQSGGYYVRRKPARTNPQAADEALARGLWERSADLITARA